MLHVIYEHYCIFYQGTHTDLVVQIVLIAESMRLQAMMATYGIQTQTPHEVEPVQILSSNQLVKVYQKLGVNKKLNLQGRPARPIGSLGTSKVCMTLYFFFRKIKINMCIVFTSIGWVTKNCLLRYLHKYWFCARMFQIQIILKSLYFDRFSLFLSGNVKKFFKDYLKFLKKISIFYCNLRLKYFSICLYYCRYCR